MAELRVVENPAGEAARRVAEVAGAQGTIALAGGSTPRAAYEAVAEMEVDWFPTSLWWSDDRCVPHEHEDSNFRMVHEALLGRIPQPGPEVHPIHCEQGDPHAAAERYEQELRAAFRKGVPVFDLLLLGLGPDAHCASLFPGKPAVHETERLVVGVDEPGMDPRVARVSFTFPLINAAREVMFLVAGEDKSRAVAEAFGGRGPRPEFPASLVAPQDGTLTVVLDPPAASLLPEPAA